MGLCTDEVVAPDMIGVLGTQPHAGPVVEPQPPSRLLLLWNLQPLTTPDSLYPVLADLPACPLEQRRDPTIAIATILTGQRYDGLGERIMLSAQDLVTAADATWGAVENSKPKIFMEERQNNGDWVRQWRRALEEFPYFE
jgi:hypothetical protein